MLARATTRYGGTHVFQGTPRLRFARHALFVPYGTNGPGGIFDQEGLLISESAFVRGIPDEELVARSVAGALNPTAVRRTAEPRMHLYLGAVHPHFGHFLVSSLSRLWPLRLLSSGMQDVRILISNPGAPAGHLGADYVQTLLSALGLQVSNFVTYNEPTIIPDIMVPAPAFIENHCAYTEFAGFCEEIGARIPVPAGVTLPSADTPVYLTKQRMTSGVSRIVNEAEFTDILERAGVAIISPEHLPFAAQVELHRTHRTISGTIGSAIHTAIFAASQHRLILNHGQVVWSNQLLLDGCNGSRSTFLHPGDTLTNDGGDDHFGNNFRLHDPVGTATQFLQALDMIQRDPPRPVRSDAPGAEMRRFAFRPLGDNVSIGKPAMQSSGSPWSSDASLTMSAAGAVSGRLTGSFQFHTGVEHKPWWQVDLEASTGVNGVIVYNRIDVGAERANAICLLGSLDGANWTELARRVDDTPFGGQHGEPWSIHFTVPQRIRYVRLQLLDTGILHLDQVEVFGSPLDALDAMLD